MATLRQPINPSSPSVFDELRVASAQLADRVLSHPFLMGCVDGRTSLDQLRAFLVQHGKYSRYFTRYLCALISQLENVDDVLRLADNLAEELGFGADAGTRVPHSHIYASLLRDFDLDLEAHPVNDETQNLIDTMHMLCRQPHGTAGLGAMCLGAEALVPLVYARLLDGFRHCGIGKERLEFFTLHIECDDDHAATMQQILVKQAERMPSCRIVALNAGEIAVSARLRFFDALMQ
jgi:pyrroloquinoline quinone (PQQ) biosynthesis protein C